MRYFFLIILVALIPVALFLYVGDKTNDVTIEPPLSSPTGQIPEVNRYLDFKGREEILSKPNLPIRKKTQKEKSKILSIRTSLSTQKPKEGDVVLLNIFDKSLIPKAGIFMDKPISFFNYKNNIVAFLPIPIGSIGNQPLRVLFKNGEEMTRTIYVQKRKFPIYNVGIPKKLGITATELIKKLADEKKELNKILDIKTKKILFSKPFIMPINKARITGTFGEIRKTGKNEIRHLGIDFGALSGSVVVASNDGVVKKAESSPIYGNMVIIDHGEGIFSMYLHMKTIFVSVGDSVKRGDKIGEIGDTGYSTGKHLHLSMKINNISIDPLRFIKVLK